MHVTFPKLYLYLLEILPLCYVVNYLYFGHYYGSEEVYFSNPDTKPPGFRPSQHNTSASHVTPVLTQHHLAGSRYPPDPSRAAGPFRYLLPLSNHRNYEDGGETGLAAETPRFPARPSAGTPAVHCVGTNGGDSGRALRRHRQRGDAGGDLSSPARSVIGLR